MITSLRSLALVSSFALVLAGGCGDDVSAPPQREGGVVDQSQADLPTTADLTPSDTGGKEDQGGSADQGGPCAGCTGCCKDGKCLAGTEESACGKDGAACDTCTGLDKCFQGKCQQKLPACDSSTCATCCNAQNVCIGPSSDLFCGLNGAQCQECAKSDRCDQGVCVPIATYAVTLVSAKVKNSDCGLGDDCDAYAEVGLGIAAAVKSPTKDNTETPTWNFKLFDAQDKDLLSKKLKIVVKDDDGSLNPDDLIDTCELQVTGQDLKAGTLVATCGTKVQALTFSFTKI